MDILMPLIKILTISQIILIIIFLIMMYLVKLYYYFQDKKNATNTQLVEKILNSHFEKKEHLSGKSISLLKKSINDALNVLEDIEKNHGQSNYMNSFKMEVSELVLKPMARKWASSGFWYKRFEATLCYAYGFDPKDENNLIRLLNDSSILIAINAAQVVTQFNHPILINEMISIFSKGRRLQQSLTIESIEKNNNYISSIILERLENEPNLYTRIFCYRLLSIFPQQNIASCAKQDLYFDSVDLKITLINYFLHCEDSAKEELIYSLAEDLHWEVGAAVAKALGMIDTQISRQLLTNLLHAPEWWVRHNAAASLYQLGTLGIMILKEQSPDQDKYAYETAKTVLMERGNL